MSNYPSAPPSDDGNRFPGYSPQGYNSQPYSQPYGNKPPYQSYPPPINQNPQYSPPYSQGYPLPYSTQTPYQPPYLKPSQSSYPYENYPNTQYSPPPQQQNWYSQYFNQIGSNNMQQLQEWFRSVDRDHSGKISVSELAELNFAGRRLGWETASTLIRVFDKDNSGELGFYEFASLHQFMTRMTNSFFEADKDNSGYLDANEIHHAFKVAGFQLSLLTIQRICEKFGVGKTKQGLPLEQFMRVCAHLAAVRSVFEWNDKKKKRKNRIRL